MNKYDLVEKFKKCLNNFHEFLFKESTMYIELAHEALKVFDGVNEDDATFIIAEGVKGLSDEVISEYSGFFEQIYALYQTKEFAKLLRERLKDVKNEDIIEFVELTACREELDD